MPAGQLSERAYNGQLLQLLRALSSGSIPVQLDFCYVSWLDCQHCSTS